MAALGGVLALASPEPLVAVDLTGRPWGGLGRRVGHASPATVWDAVQRLDELRAPGDADKLVQLGPTGLHAVVGEIELGIDRRPPTPAEWHPLLGQLRALYPLALLDFAQADSAMVWRALQWAAATLLVSRASADSVQHTLRLLAHLRGAGLGGVADAAVVVVVATSPTQAREVRAAERQARDAGTQLVRVPFDPVLARPNPIDPRALGRATRSALTEVAAAVLQRCPADPQAAQALMERPR